MNCNHDDSECLLCVAVTHRDVSFLQELLNGTESPQLLKKCRLNCFHKVIRLYTADLNVGNPVPMLKTLLECTKFDLSELLLYFFKNIKNRFLHLTQAGASNFVGYFSKEQLEDFLNNHFVVLANDAWRIVDEQIRKYAEKDAKEEPPLPAVRPEQKPNLASSMDYFGVSDLKTSVTHLTASSVEPSTVEAVKDHPTENLDEEKNDIIKNMPMYLETVARGHCIHAHLYVTLVRIHKILLLNDPVYNRAVIVAGRELFTALKNNHLITVEKIQFLTLSVQAIALEASRKE